LFSISKDLSKVIGTLINIRFETKKNENNFFGEIRLFDKLIPEDDVKQRIRMKRTLQALGGGASQSLVSVILFFSGGAGLGFENFFS